MSKFIKEQINKLKPSATLAINEESNRLKKSGKKIYKFGFGQSPFQIPKDIVDELKNLTTAQKYKDKLNIKVSHWNQLAQNLSGGNQQKTVIGKWLATEPKIIILDEPTKGIDVGSKSAVHEFMGELVNEGMSIIMISAELPEIMGMCDRVAVVYKGLIKRILDVSETSSEEILSYASGE